MLRIALIDDEPLVRQGLASMIGRLCPNWEIAGDACSGEEGKELLESAKPDAAIVDVRMAGMSGLDLIDDILDKGLPIAFIILSGHGEFEFVQRALRMGVYDYLLKPVKRSELTALLAKLENKLLLEREEKAQHVQLVKYKRESEQRVIEQTVQTLIRGEMLNAEQFHVLADNGYDLDRHPYVLLRMEIDPESLIGKAKTRKDEQLFRLFFHQVVSELIHEYGKSIIAPGKDDSVLILFPFASGDDYSMDRLAQLCGQIKKVIKEYAKLDVSAGISSLLTGLHNVKTAYFQAVDSISNSTNERHVMKAIEFIQQHFYDKLSLEEVASHVHLHPNYLSELFHKKTGVHFSEYVTRVRIQEAKRLLSDTNCKIEDVSERAGFMSYRHFCRVFHKQEGVSPSSYRKQFFASRHP